MIVVWTKVERVGMGRHGKIDSRYVYRPPSWDLMMDWNLNSWEKGGNQECYRRLGAGQLNGSYAIC